MEPHIINRSLSLMTAVIFFVAYGKKIRTMDDEYVTIAHNAMEGLNKASVPGAYLIELIPFAKYIPSWFPGAKVKRDAEQTYPWVRMLMEKPYGEVKRAVVSSYFLTCVV